MKVKRCSGEKADVRRRPQSPRLGGCMGNGGFVGSVGDLLSHVALVLFSFEICKF